MAGSFSLKFLSDILRAATLVAALAALYTGRGSAGIFILVMLAVTLAIKKRAFVLLKASREADWWEFDTLLLFFVNAILLVTGWYYMPRMIWIDIPMHFWGGMVAGIWAWIVFVRERAGSFSFIEKWLLVFGAAALVGVGWEFFEWVLDHVLSQWYTFPRTQPSVDDVLGDLAMDLLGGAIGGLMMKQKE